MRRLSSAPTPPAAIAPTGGIESANPVVSAAPAATTLAAVPRGSFDPTMTGTKADRKHGHRPDSAAWKPQPQDPRLQPQAQAPKPVATAAHVAHPGPRPVSTAGAQPRQIPARTSVP